MEVTKSEASKASKLYHKFHQGREKKENKKAPPQAGQSTSRVAKTESSIDLLSERNFGHVLSPRKNFERDMGKQFVLTPEQVQS